MYELVLHITQVKLHKNIDPIYCTSGRIYFIVCLSEKINKKTIGWYTPAAKLAGACWIASPCWVHAARTTCCAARNQMVNIFICE